jgi:Tfp pilus assembly protein PilN
VALANYVDHRIWLTHILFNAKTDNIILEGATYKAEQIPLLLQGLQASTIFKGRHFAKLSIDKTEAHSDQIDFTVNSSLKSKEEGANVDKH